MKNSRLPTTSPSLIGRRLCLFMAFWRAPCFKRRLRRWSAPNLLAFPTLTVSISFDFYHIISFYAACKGAMPDGLAGVFPGRFRLIAREYDATNFRLDRKQNQCTNIDQQIANKTQFREVRVLHQVRGEREALARRPAEPLLPTLTVMNSRFRRRHPARRVRQGCSARREFSMHVRRKWEVEYENSLRFGRRFARKRGICGRLRLCGRT